MKFFVMYLRRHYKIVSCKGAFLNDVQFRVVGDGNKIIIERNAKLKSCQISVTGDNCHLFIGGGGTNIKNTSFCCQDDNSEILIGSDFTMESGHIAATEGKQIIIGNDCMFSNDIEIRNGDSHSIIKAHTEQRINWGKAVIIGDHVWLTAHVRILKGSYIPNHTIIANSSIVTSNLEEPYAIYGGNPVKLLKAGTDWDRNRYKYRKL